MLFLVELDHVKSGDLPTQEIARPFIEQIILPTLARIEELVSEKKTVAGGLAAGRISPRLIIEAESATEVDRMLLSIPLWPAAETRVTPLVSVNERRHRVQEVLKRLPAQAEK